MKSIDHGLREKNKTFIGLMKYELRRKIMKKFVAIIRKAYSYLMDDSNSNEKAKGTKKCVIKRILKILFI